MFKVLGINATVKSPFANRQTRTKLQAILSRHKLTLIPIYKYAILLSAKRVLFPYCGGYCSRMIVVLKTLTILSLPVWTSGKPRVRSPQLQRKHIAMQIFFNHAQQDIL